MKILIAPDSFKEALSAPEVCSAISRGLKRSNTNFNTIIFPLADGGEGTAEILTRHHGGRITEVEVSDPLLRPIKACYGLSQDGRTAFIEMAAASGLQLLTTEERNPLHTSTCGTGELILDAYQNGARHFVLCIGGSATHDLGLGMAEALGFIMRDKSGKPLSEIRGKSLSQIYTIDDSKVKIKLSEITVEVLCDVNNPLTGPNGAAHVYARQKGADDAAVAQLEAGSKHLSQLLSEYAGIEVGKVPGAGAAGGLGAGAMALLGVQLKPGIATILDRTNFDEQLKTADLVISGEGRLDAQTGSGKLIHGICRRAHTFGVPVIALCGQVSAGPQALTKMGLLAAFSICPGPIVLEAALENTEKYLEASAFNVGQLLTMLI